MPKLNEEAKDTETDGVVPKPLTASQLAAMGVAGLVGGFIGAMGLGLVGVLIGGASARGQIIEAVGIKAASHGFWGAVLGLPLGIAMGLRTAGTRLGIRGRFWPTAAGAYSGLLIPLLGPMTFWMKDRWLPEGVLPAVGLLSPLLSLVGGLVVFQLCGRRLWRDAIFAVLVLLVTTTVVLFDRISTESRRPPPLLQPPAFLPYPGRTFDVHSSAPGATRVYECKVETDDSPAAVVDFYEKALARWENSPERVRSRPQGTNVASVNYRTRDRKQSVSVWITVDPLSKKTVIGLQYWKFFRAPTPEELGLRPGDWTN